MDNEETDAARPVPSPVVRERRRERELERGMPPPRVQNKPRLEEGTEPECRVPTTVGYGLCPVLEGVKDAVDGGPIQTVVHKVQVTSNSHSKVQDWRRLALFCGRF